MTLKAQPLKAPFPYFGGKSRIASVVWQALGDVGNYVEPFAGSLAVLLARPEEHKNSRTTVNDADGFLANFWRALSMAPDAVAEHADWPVNEIDLTARHVWLVNHGDELSRKLIADPDFFDAKAAGWWVWGISQWIGSGWCSGDGPWNVVDGELVKSGVDRGVAKKLPHLGNGGRGVHRQLPHLGNGGRGVHRKRPHLGDGGNGVHRQRPHLGDGGNGVHRESVSSIHDMMRELAAKLRGVRVCCGDWMRVCKSPSVVFSGASTAGVFLDPPYASDRAKLYAHDSFNNSKVLEWCIKWQDKARIVLAGHDGEYVLPGWRVVEWNPGGGYSTQSAEGSRGKANRKKERLWISPMCNDVDGQLTL